MRHSGSSLGISSLIRMRTSADPGLVRRLSVFASAASLFSVAVGMSGLAGWLFHIPALATWGAAPVKMVANTAACFVLLGACLWLLRKSHTHPCTWARRFAANTAAATAGLVGWLSLLEHLFGQDLHIDQLLFLVSASDHAAGVRPGLMSSITASNFLILSLAFLLLDWKTRRDDWPAQFLGFGAMLGTMFGFFALILSSSTYPTSMAWPTTVTFFVLISGLICSRAPWALGGLLVSRSAAAKLVRRAVPASLLVLSLIGWLISKPLLTEEHFAWVEVSLLALFSCAALTGFVVWMASIVERADSQRRKIEEAFSVKKEEMDRLLNGIEEPEAETSLRRKVEAGFVVAVVLTMLLGVLSWHLSQLTAEDAYWVAHTREVMATLESTLRHLVDVETGGRGFALTGDERFLEPYETGKNAVSQDLQALRLLTADNHDQQRQLDVLWEQASARIEASKDLVALKQKTGSPPTEAQLERGKQIMDAARATVEQMEAEEKRLLEQRSRRARAAQRVTVTIIGLGSILGAVFLAVAGFAVSREIGISARARAQVNALNAELEQRVAQRTAALGESEGRLSSIIQSAMDAIITTDDQQRILVFNKSAEIMFRCPAVEAVGQSITRFIPERFHAAHDRHFKKFSENGSTTRAMGALGTLWGERADGAEFRIEASISHIRSGGRNLSTVILRDITERVRAEALREHLASVVDSSDDAIISKDLSGVITGWNRGAEKVFGYTAAEAVGKPMLMLFPNGRGEEEADILSRIGRGESVEHFETLRVRKDGTKIDVSVTISPIRDGGGVIVGASKIARDITERKQTEAALRESENRFRTLIEQASDAFFLHDSDGRFLEVNRQACESLGYTREELLRMRVSDVECDLDTRKAQQAWEQAEPGKAYTLQGQQRRKDGTAFPVEVRLSAYYVGGEKLHLGLARDTTERKRAEDALAAQAEELSRQTDELLRSQSALEAQSLMLKLILQSVGEGLIAADREGKFIIWNDSAKKLMGRDSASLPSDQWTHYYKVFLPDGVTPYPPERLPLVRALRGESVQVELMVEQPEHAESVFLEVTARPMKDAEGGLCGGVAVLRDITEHKRAAATLARQAEELLHSQQALETQTLMLQSVLDSIGEGLVAADETGKFLLWNPAATRIVGMGAENVPPGEWNRHYGVYLPDTVTPFPPEQNPLQRAIRGEVCVAEMYLRNQELESGVWIETSASPLKNRDGVLHGGVIAIRDITQRRLDEQKIRQLNEELEERVVQRTAQLEAANHELEAFTYSVSHDLRAPLRHIGGFSRILLEDFSATMEPEARQHLQRIEDGTRRMGMLVDELLNLARVGRHALHLQSASLNAVIEEVVSMLQPEVAGRAVSWKIADLPPAECDPILIRQVFQNLLANALKFTRPRERAVIEVGHRKENGQTVIFVRDNGVGFNMKYQDKLFGVFQRLHRAEDFEGTGIGLATVQRIVHKHGGRVWAEAEPDKGATFFFTLAAAQPTDIKPTEVTNKSAAAAGGEI